MKKLDHNLPIIATKAEWARQAQQTLRLAFDALKESRDLLKAKNLLLDQYEPMFQQAGRAMLDLAKSLKNVK